jgi:queuine tRNA-ribosyltransferase
MTLSDNLNNAGRAMSPGPPAEAGPFFTVERRDERSRARAGVIRTARGPVPTPTFMPVGTRGTVKAVAPDDLAAAGAKIVLANTYHLMLRPGPELLSSLGGLNKFMGWPGPTITDSGGYQVFSLTALRKMTGAGVFFRSAYDGSEVFLSPEKAVELQTGFGVDILMCLDECTTYPAGRGETEKSLELTSAWAARCRGRWGEIAAEGPGPAGALFGICQGGFFPDLRRRSASEINELDFPGQAVGGLALGEPLETRLEAVEAAAEVLDPAKPLYLMGLGTPRDLIEGIKRGADLFDCVMPTRNARNGQLFTRRGKINILNSRFKNDPLPPDPDCGCYACRNFSRAYLRHLHQNKEPLYLRLASVHNLKYYLDLTAGARNALQEGDFLCYYKQFYNLLEEGV